MGVYNPNMDKPKDCNSCRFLEGDAMDGLCHAMNLWLDDESLRWYAYEEDDIDDSKPLDCPLIEIVRCKECKWCEKSGGILWCNIWHDDTNGLNFCSYAERRTE